MISSFPSSVCCFQIFFSVAFRTFCLQLNDMLMSFFACFPFFGPGHVLKVNDRRGFLLKLPSLLFRGAEMIVIDLRWREIVIKCHWMTKLLLPGPSRRHLPSLAATAFRSGFQLPRVVFLLIPAQFSPRRLGQGSVSRDLPFPSYAHDGRRWSGRYRCHLPRTLYCICRDASAI